MAGAVAVSLHDRFRERGWLASSSPAEDSYALTRDGAAAFDSLGIDVQAARSLRRRFAYPCVDWSERRPHLAGALGAALLDLALRRRWVTRDIDSRILEVTPRGRREMSSRLGVSG
jgi:hypothetical protein